MAEIDLKAYISRAKELEAALYTHKKMTANHKKIMESASPTTPTMRIIPQPKEPVRHMNKPVSHNVRYFLLGVLLISLAGINAICVLTILFSFAEIHGAGTFSTIILGLAGWSFLKSCIEERKKIELKNEYEAQRYEKAMADYHQQQINHSAEVQKAIGEYNVAMQKHYGALADYNDALTDMMNRYDTTLLSLENALKKHYSQNVVFEKYRNLVAISTFEEYLMSGRCETLEGANGAYNLYEMELRQNVIINQLSSIISNLEQIRNNQYTLYHELTKANDTVNDVLCEVRDVKETTKLAAYFAGVSAMIEASPKVYIGRTY